MKRVTFRRWRVSPPGKGVMAVFYNDYPDRVGLYEVYLDGTLCALPVEVVLDETVPAQPHEYEARRIAMEAEGYLLEVSPPCPPDCPNMASPYCHCCLCGETGVPLDNKGLCAACR